MEHVSSTRFTHIVLYAALEAIASKSELTPSARARVALQHWVECHGTPEDREMLDDGRWYPLGATIIADALMTALGQGVR